MRARLVLLPLLLASACSSSPSSPSGTAGPSASAAASDAAPSASGRTAQQLVLNRADLAGLRVGAASGADRTVAVTRTLLLCLGGSVNGIDGAASPTATTGRTSVTSAAFVLADASRAAEVLSAARTSPASACVSSYVAGLGTDGALRVQPQSASTGAAFQVSGTGLVADVRIQVGGRSVAVLAVLTSGARTAPAAQTALVQRFVATLDRRVTPTG